MRMVTGLVIVITLFTPLSNAQVAPYNPEGDLNQIEKSFNKIERYLLNQDLGQLASLQSALDHAKTDLSTYGIGNKNTLQSLFRMVLSIRYSKSFFATCAANNIKSDIDFIEEREHYISKRVGFEKISGFTIVHDIAENMQKLLNQMLNLPSLDSEFILKIREFKDKDLQLLIIKASFGDDLPALLTAKKIHDDLDLMKPLFRNAGTSKPLFKTMGELYTLNDVLSGYAGFRLVQNDTEVNPK